MEKSSGLSRLPKSLLLLFCFFAVLLFVEFPGSWLFDPDEARYAEIPQQMAATGDFLTPRLNGSNYFEKPPLLYWLNALSFRVMGETPFAARFPTRLAALGIAVFLILSLKRAGQDAGLCAAVVYLSALLPFSLARVNITDHILTFGLTLALLSFRDVLITENGAPHKTLDIFKIWLGVSIAFLAKGLIGLVLPAIIVVAWTGLMGGGKRLWPVLFSMGAIFFFVVSLPWFVLMEIRHPGFLKIFFVREHLLRYFTDAANRPGSFLYFVPVFLLGLLPWTPYFFAAVRKLIVFDTAELRRRPDEIFFALWLLVVIAFFSFSHSKLIPYVLPAFPAAAALTGLYLAGKKNGAKTLQLIGAASMGVCLIILYLVPSYARDYSARDLAEKAARANAAYIVSFRSIPHSFPFILKEPIPVVDYQGELASDDVLSADLFWAEEKFWPLWNSDRRMVAVFRKSERALFNLQPVKPVFLGENRTFVLAANFTPDGNGS